MTMQYKLTEEGKQVINELVQKYYKCVGEVNPSKSVEQIFEEEYYKEYGIEPCLIRSKNFNKYNNALRGKK